MAPAAWSAPRFRVVLWTVPDALTGVGDVPETPSVVGDAVEDAEPNDVGRLDGSLHQVRQVAVGQQRGELPRDQGPALSVEGPDAKAHDR